MSMRTSSALVCLVLAACGDRPDEVDGAREEKISCAVDGEADFAQVCTVRRDVGGRGVTLTLSAPSGGFRRLVVTHDGRGVVAADGAEPAIVTPVTDGSIEIALGSDRYRIPATIKSREPRQ